MREKSVRRRDQRGASTLEMVLIAPVLIFALMAIVQFGLYFHAKNVAEQAAQEGAAAARAFDGTESSAQGVTEDYLTALGESTLQGRSVSVNRGPQSASVTVRGTALSLIPVPGFNLQIEETASGPVERYVPPVGE
jgi:Flp pilus assembly protein TadG